MTVTRTSHREVFLISATSSLENNLGVGEVESSRSGREMQAYRPRDPDEESLRGARERVRPIENQGLMGAVHRQSVWVRQRWSLKWGPSQALPIPGVLKPVTVAIP